MPHAKLEFENNLINLRPQLGPSLFYLIKEEDLRAYCCSIHLLGEATLILCPMVVFCTCVIQNNFLTTLYFCFIEFQSQLVRTNSSEVAESLRGAGSGWTDGNRVNNSVIYVLFEITFSKNQGSQAGLERSAKVDVCNQNWPEFYWGIKRNELCVLCAPSVYLISIFFPPFCLCSAWTERS